jgi:hypothetical protein
MGSTVARLLSVGAIRGMSVEIVVGLALDYVD